MRQLLLFPIAFGILIFVNANIKPSLAQSDQNSGNYLINECRAISTDSSKGLFQQGRCMGIVEGIAWASPDICRPSQITNGQAVKVLVAYMDRQPQLLHQTLAQLAHEALVAVWPCAKR
jgi:hypothetical protein